MLSYRKRSKTFLILFLVAVVKTSEPQGGCSLGMWGPNCTGVCHCALGDPVCSIVDGQCTSGHCSKGYSGEPYCQTVCPVGTYGSSCASTCHCPAADVCNHINGLCSSNQCEVGWSGSGCATRLPTLSSLPNITSTSQTSITVTWRRWDASLDVGDPPVAEYHLQYRRETENTWHTSAVVQVESPGGGEELYLRVITGLAAKIGYVLRLALARLEDDKIGEIYPGPTTSIIRTCSAPSQPVENVMAKQDLQTDGLATIFLSWEAPDVSTSGCDYLASYNVHLTCGDNLCPPIQVSVPYHQLSFTFRDVRPDVEKHIVIYPVNDAETLGPSALFFAAAIQGTTSDDGKVELESADLSPGGGESGLILISRSEDALELIWTDTEATKYTITATIVDSYSLADIMQPVHQKITVTGTSITLHNLHTATQYAITIQTPSAILYQRTFWTHPSQPPYPLNPSLKEVSDSSVTLSIQPFSIQTGPLTAYQVVVEEVTSLAYHRVKRSVLNDSSGSEIIMQNDSGNNTVNSKASEELNLTVKYQEVFHNKFMLQGKTERLISSITFENLTDFFSAQSAHLNHYITASLSSTQVVHGVELLVGDGNTYGRYYNAPLKPGTRYNIWIGITSRLDGVNKQTFANVLGTESSEYTLTTKEVGFDSVSEVEKETNISLIVGVILVILFLILIALVIYLMWKRDWELPEPIIVVLSRGRAMVTRAFHKDRFSKEWNQVEESRLEAGDAGLQVSQKNTSKTSSPVRKLPEQNGIRVEDFTLYYNQVTKSVRILGDEFQKMKANLEEQVTETTFVANLVQNIHMNRSSKSLPYDFNRVALETDSDDANDYINASYLCGLPCGKCIIAQSPLPMTIPHFWRAVWDYKVGHIVMLVSPEDVTDNVPEYWPTQGETRTEGNVSVKFMEEESFANYTVRSVEITKTDENEIRYLRHFQYKLWKPTGVPMNTIGFIDFIRRCHRNTDPNDTYLIHCQCGTGRSGEFLAIKILADEAKKTGYVDVHGVVEQLRHQRMNLVKNLSQYRFIHEALSEVTGNMSSVIPANELTPYYHNLTHVMRGNKLNFNCEFEQMFKLSQTLGDPASRFLSPAKLSLTGRKPRSPLIPHALKTTFVDSYKDQRHFIITDHPSESKLPELWNLLLSTGCHTIIRITDKENTYMPIIPEHLQAKYYGAYLLSNEEHYPILEDLTEYKLSVQDGSLMLGNTLDITLLDLTWPVTGVAPSPNAMSQIGVYLSKKAKFGTGKVAILERKGSGCGGLVCGCLYLIEMLDTQGEVDVFRSIKYLRSQVPDAVTLEDEYRYCYRVLKEHGDRASHTPIRMESGVGYHEHDRSLPTQQYSQDSFPAPPPTSAPWKSPFPVHTSTPKWHQDVSLISEDEDDGQEHDKENQEANFIQSKSSFVQRQGSGSFAHSPKTLAEISKNDSKDYSQSSRNGSLQKSFKNIQLKYDVKSSHLEETISSDENDNSNVEDWKQILRKASAKRKSRERLKGLILVKSKGANNRVGENVSKAMCSQQDRELEENRSSMFIPTSPPQDTSLKINDLQLEIVNETPHPRLKSPSQARANKIDMGTRDFGDCEKSQSGAASIQDRARDFVSSSTRKRNRRLEKIGKALPAIGGQRW